MADAFQIMKPKVLVLTGYGFNCDYETKHTFELAGAEAEIVHVNDLIFGEKNLVDYHILAVIGGFTYGDDIAAGKILSSRLKNNLWPQLEKFIADGKLIIGICNGFQALVKAGLLPALSGHDKQEVTLTFNDSGKFEDRWITLKFNEASPCVWTKGVDFLDMPIRHGEGKFFTEAATMKHLLDKNLVVGQYAKNGALANGSYPENPNGSPNDVAAICDPTGRIFGLMPHPEAFNHITNHPNWTAIREQAKRQGKKLDELGAGVQIFKNAVDYASEKLM
jgi:phosphoribosylformylglycinamidine synthase subunit PurQ / glutaminase